MTIKRIRHLITGLVQGVGFRPVVYRIANQLRLTGWVKNSTSGVLIEIQGALVNHFLSQLQNEQPDLAKIDAIQSIELSLLTNEHDFRIIASEPGQAQTQIAPDTAICSLCLQELFDANSHYYHYPFLNCTHCGPRLTITKKLPYDRKHTAMATFPLCTSCHQDYHDPNNRRYHAQPTACTHCGPHYSLAVHSIAQLIQQGKIIALKGMGGYQLIADARNEQAILNLRQRKNRPAKPFALMVANLESAKQIVQLNATAKQLLNSQARPIVLLPKLNDQLHEILAPGLTCLGIALPCTPVHYLLFHALDGYKLGNDWLNKFQSTILIVTSANSTNHPLLIDDEEAQEQLYPIAEQIISYNREIVTRNDDSVVKIINKQPIFIRRARGYAPTPIKLAHEVPVTLGLGGQLKNTFCITRGNEAFVSQHIGNLTNKATIEFYHETLNYFLNFLNVKPQRLATDMHPDFYTTNFAQEFDIPIYAIQHHHAHLAAVAAEHHIQQPALGLALDGYGYGNNGEAWGGELLLLENTTFQRLGYFYPLPQPGGEIAAREPWRMAASILYLLNKSDEIIKRFHAQPHAYNIQSLLENKIKTPLTSSCGRYFDAACAMLGINQISQYEGQAAMQLEALVTQPQVLSNGWSIDETMFNMIPTFSRLLSLDAISGANLFHGTLIAGLTEWILTWAERFSINVVLLNGGCFLNKVLTEGLTQNLEKCGIKYFLPRQLPPNDGGLSLGQAWLAATM